MARCIPASPQPPSSRSSSPARQSYKEQGACLRCGSYDHWLADCDAPPPLSKNTRCALGLEPPSLPADTPYTILRKSPKSKAWNSYRTSGACLRCGGFNHWLTDCPKPAQPSSQSNTQSAGKSGKKVMITAINDNSYLYWDSESTGSID